MNLLRFLGALGSIFTVGCLLCHKRVAAAETTTSSNPPISADAIPGIKNFSPNPKTGASTTVIVDDLPLIYTGQLLPLNQKGEVTGPGDPAKQTEQLLAKLDLVLKAAGSGLRNAI